MGGVGLRGEGMGWVGGGWDGEVEGGGVGHGKCMRIPTLESRLADDQQSALCIAMGGDTTDCITRYGRFTETILHSNQQANTV